MMRKSAFIGAFGLGLVAACGGLLGDGSDDGGTDGGVSSNDASGTTELDSTAPPLDAGTASDASATDAPVDAIADSTTDAVADAAIDAPVDAGPETAVSLSTNSSQTCFVNSGHLYCTSGAGTPAAVVSDVNDAVEVGVGGGSGTVLSGIFFGGGYFRCFRRAGGTVECSGVNDLGQLGDGTIGYATGVNTFRATFAPVLGLTDAVQLSVGTGNHACARRATGSVVCWGGNSSGALGDGSAAFAKPPTTVVGLTDAIDLSVNLFGACAVRAGGQVVCWGNHDGSTADGVPVDIAGLTDAVAVAKGPYFTHAIRADGSVWGWGRRGPWIGNGVSDVSCTGGPACITPPVQVVGIASATKITGGGHQLVSFQAGACALRPSGVVSCWGAGALGNGGSNSSSVPVDVLGITDALGLSRGQTRGCAIHPAGRISCWVGSTAPVDVVW